MLVGGESVFEQSSHLLWREPAAWDRYDEGDWHLAELVVGSGYDGGLLDVRTALKHGLEIAGVDACAPDDDRVLEPADDVEVAIPVDQPEVAAAKPRCAPNLKARSISAGVSEGET